MFVPGTLVAVSSSDWGGWCPRGTPVSSGDDKDGIDELEHNTDVISFLDACQSVGLEFSLRTEGQDRLRSGSAFQLVEISGPVIASEHRVSMLLCGRRGEYDAACLAAIGLDKRSVVNEVRRELRLDE